MDGILRDAVIKLGGPLPVIGSGLILFALLAWAAWNLHESQETVFAVVIGGAAFGVAIAVLISVPTAKTNCRDLYRNDRMTYISSNCEILVNCVANSGVFCR